MARIAVQLAVPVALGLSLGLVIAFQAGSGNSGTVRVPLGAPVSPSPSASALAVLATAPASTPTTSVDCDLIVPADPLSARGLATPYQLTGVDGMTPAASGCRNIVDIQTPFLAANRTLLAAGQSPVTAAGDNLLAYLANRLSMSFANLGCQHFGLANPVTVTRDGAGAVIAATFTTTPQRAAAAMGAS